MIKRSETRIVLSGKSISESCAQGILHFLCSADRGEKHQTSDVSDEKQDKVPVIVGELESELRWINMAREEAVSQLMSLAEQSRNEGDEEAAALWDAHVLLVKSSELENRIRDCLDSEKCTAEYAVQRAGEQISAVFEAMDDEYIRARAADIRDVVRRIMGCLRVVSEGDNGKGFSRDGKIFLKDVPEKRPGEEVFDENDAPIILAADDILPSELIRLDRNNIAGLVLRRGSYYSHAMILARTWGIPVIFNLGKELKEEFEGLTVYLDGEKGSVILDPDEKQLDALAHKRAVCRNYNRGSTENENGISDKSISILCNINFPEDAKLVLQNGGQGIGLFRTEYLYLASGGYPSEEDQFQAYRKVAAAMEGKPVVIRTWDVGADKMIKCSVEGEHGGDTAESGNRGDGIRGIRRSLEHPEAFRTQLRAIYRASVSGNVSIMFPMVTSLWEVQEAKQICREVIDELRHEGVYFADNVEIGVMIETREAVSLAHELAKEVDFFSVGTNDLTCELLGYDRFAGEVIDVNDSECVYNFNSYADDEETSSDSQVSYDRRILRDSVIHQLMPVIRTVADAAHAADIRIAICGELASDVSLLQDFIDMGIDELSVAPGMVSALRNELCRYDGENNIRNI